MFVEGRSEVGVQQVPVVKGLPDDAADEFEVLEVETVDVALRRGVEGVASAARLEESVVGVEHLFRQQLEPLSSDAPGVLTLLLLELYLKFAFEQF